jgi:hypothetical protein
MSYASTPLRVRMPCHTHIDIANMSFDAEKVQRLLETVPSLSQGPGGAFNVLKDGKDCSGQDLTRLLGHLARFQQRLLTRLLSNVMQHGSQLTMWYSAR